MDLLENYKKVWDNQPEETHKLSAVDIYKMAHSKSSSIVKWIFIVGVLELAFWLSINLLVPDSFYKIYSDLNLEKQVSFFMILHYIIIIVFLYFFYASFKKISIIENTKSLIQRILNIRNTVKFYVYYNLAIVFLSSLALNIVLMSDSDKLMKVMNPENLSIDINQLITITIISQIIAIIIFMVLLWFFYKLIYGILLKKLNRNYKELSKLESAT
ncbi:MULTISPECIES: hypothetical protein [unclassified Polaribacter]|uniref:hypothetical protein n=1 Tax=unclassified Polaribacter TaxID=196858 RepID=UPI0011BF596F|nr:MULTISPECIES: hypothetical protein [unclassified Polaribacter]TXD52895.1 hypothetical protein ES043_06715 [Polaribacter sp. IC063]TXD60841.1 hypothetical protein ES044_06680 [Polaribacter sp. IC066]